MTKRYSVAMAAGADAATASMRTAGRSKWSLADYQKACAEFNRIDRLRYESTGHGGSLESRIEAFRKATR